MQATIVNYRQGKHTQKDSHMVLSVQGVTSKADAAKLVGKSVVYKTQTGKEIKGTISSSHGNSGAVRAVFEKGMPGQSLSARVDIQ